MSAVRSRELMQFRRTTLGAMWVTGWRRARAARRLLQDVSAEIKAGQIVDRINSHGDGAILSDFGYI